MPAIVPRVILALVVAAVAAFHLRSRVHHTLQRLRDRFAAGPALGCVRRGRRRPSRRPRRPRHDLELMPARELVW